MGIIVDKIIDFKTKHKGGISWRVKKHARVLENYINDDEIVTYAFCAQKNETFKDIFNTYAICLTNKRIILGHKRLLWGSFFYSITPELYNDMEIYKGLMWGKITIDTVKELVILTNLPKSSLDEIETNISKFMLEAKKKQKNEKE